MGKVTKDKSRYCTWLVFMNSKWVPFDQINQYRLDQTLGLESTFVDIQDSHFPDVRRVRVFPKVNYLSYLGLKYRISKVMEIDAWSVYESSSTRTTTTSEKSSSSLPEIHYLPVPFNNNNSNSNNNNNNNHHNNRNKNKPTTSTNTRSYCVSY